MASKLTGCKVLLGVCGGIAAYKAADLAGKLTGAGAVVQTILTVNACELITPKTFEAVTGQAAYTSMWVGPEDFRIGHISLADWAQVVVIAPATANLFAKLVGGLCDDLLSTTLCAAWQKPIILAPAMNTKMWSNPAVQRNVKATEQMGATLVGPMAGRLACGTEGIGRMAEPAEILQAIETALA
ncbi:MAG: phosphopantothenoylcysteine decarboxylase [Sedimentisphaerales bacterium]|nr:phosphopantothenoylcysteine decarboxylase [Sedimentisphaerales bacterium]